jgi:hypothetical protein
MEMKNKKKKHRPTVPAKGGGSAVSVFGLRISGFPRISGNRISEFAIVRS